MRIIETFEKLCLARHLLIKRDVVECLGRAEQAPYRLDIRFMSVPPNVMLAMLDSISMASSCIIKEILIEGFPLGRQPAVDSIVKLLKKRWPSLTSLRLRDCNISDEYGAEIIKAVTSTIRCLDLTNNECSILTARALGNVKNSNIRRLWLDQNPLNDAGVAALVESLDGNNKLVELSIQSCGAAYYASTMLMWFKPKALKILRIGYNAMADPRVVEILQRFPESPITIESDRMKLKPSVIKSHRRFKFVRVDADVEEKVAEEDIVSEYEYYDDANTAAKEIEDLRNEVNLLHHMLQKSDSLNRMYESMSHQYSKQEELPMRLSSAKSYLISTKRNTKIEDGEQKEYEEFSRSFVDEEKSAKSVLLSVEQRDAIKQRIANNTRVILGKEPQLIC